MNSPPARAARGARRPPRGAWTVMEMLVVTSISAVLMGLSVTTIQLLLRAEREASRGATWSAAAARLNRQVRDDVRLAVGILAPGEGAALVLTLPDGRRVRYQASQHAAVRELLDGQRLVHRESFRFRPGSSISFSWRDRDRLVCVAVVESPVSPAGRTPRAAGELAGATCVIEAAPRQPAQPAEVQP